MSPEQIQDIVMGTIAGALDTGDLIGASPEMREQPLSGMQTVGEFMQRRLAPAIATVKVTSERLAALAERVADFRPDLVVLAGFMRVLGADFVHRFPARIINIHPSLLPAFPGLNTHRRALDAGVRVHGATVHYVTEALDAGPIIAQAAVPVLEDDDEQSLAARVLKQEHRLLPNAVIDICCERIGLDVSGKLWTRPGARRLLADDFNACALAVPGLSGAP
ncbi:MAG: phosphoribosylglycinamide formyltransferase [Betaproteobacteria bacterium]|nr:phosphoribosylglycinamide formyltransferase [Betaproteobacteria bacterium]